MHPNITYRSNNFLKTVWRNCCMLLFDCVHFASSQSRIISKRNCNYHFFPDTLNLSTMPSQLHNATDVACQFFLEDPMLTVNLRWKSKCCRFSTAGPSISLHFRKPARYFSTGLRKLRINAFTHLIPSREPRTDSKSKGLLKNWRRIAKGQSYPFVILLLSFCLFLSSCDPFAFLLWAHPYVRTHHPAILIPSVRGFRLWTKKGKRQLLDAHLLLLRWLYQWRGSASSFSTSSTRPSPSWPRTRYNRSY